MHQVTSEEAVAHLTELIKAAMRGERVVISDDAQHAVLLVPVTPERRQRHAGSTRGLIVMSEDFDAPLADFEAYM